MNIREWIKKRCMKNYYNPSIVEQAIAPLLEKGCDPRYKTIGATAKEKAREYWKEDLKTIGDTILETVIQSGECGKLRCVLFLSKSKMLVGRKQEDKEVVLDLLKEDLQYQGVSMSYSLNEGIGGKIILSWGGAK